MATPSQTLATDASCLSACIPQGMAWYGLLAVLDAIAQGDTVPSTPQEIVTAAACYSQCIPLGLLPYALIVAAQGVASGGGGSGEGAVMTDSFDDPNGNVTPADPTKGAWYYQDGAANNNLWRWSVDDQAWYQSLQT